MQRATSLPARPGATALAGAARALALTLAFGLGLLAGCSDDTGSEDTGATVGDSAVVDAAISPDGDGGVTGDTGADASSSCSLSVSKINGTAVASITELSSKYDKDTGKAGIQIDVEVKADGAADGTTVSLSVSALSPKPTAKASSGVATFKAVTVASSLKLVEIKPEAAGCSGAMLSFNLVPDPSCSFTQPKAGVTLTQSDDTIAGTPELDYNVTVQVKNGAGGKLTLTVPGNNPATKTVSSTGKVTFPNAQIPSGSNTLSAKIAIKGLSATCKVAITVDVAAPKCAITGFSPKAVTITNGLGLGPKQDADSNTSNGLQTTITVSTVANAAVTLYDGTTSLGQATADSNGKATFSNETLAEGEHDLEATCVASNKNKADSPQRTVTVDLTKPKAVTDLKCEVKCFNTSCSPSSANLGDNRKGKITCTFTSVSDGTKGSGVEKYQVHYRKNSAISASNFDASGTLKKSPDLQAASSGTTQTFSVSSLTMPDTFYFALKAVDKLGNVSDISNLTNNSAKIDFRVQTITGSTTGETLGYPIAVGDFNCDKLVDVAVGLNNANSKKGEVRLYFSRGKSSKDPLPTSFSKRIQGTEAGGYLGARLNVLDYNGDGCDDLIVSASKGNSGTGRILVYLGRTIWTDRTDTATGTGAELIFQLGSTAASTESLGFAVAGADLDGDGNDDAAMTHWRTDGTKFSDILVFYGDSTLKPLSSTASPSINTLPAAADLKVTGGSQAAFFGARLERGGLLDKDKYEELLISASRTSGGGAAHVLRGAAKSTSSGQETVLVSGSRVATIAASSGNVAFGLYIAGVGDTDGDGWPEFVISDPNKTVNSASLAGEAYVFNFKNGAPSAVSSAVATITNDGSDAASDRLGAGMANGANIDPTKGADLDDDGYADIEVGTRNTGTNSFGAAHLFFGKTPLPATLKLSGARTLQPPSGATIAHGSASAFLGDVNGDGYVDLIVSDFLYSSSTGRMLVYY